MIEELVTALVIATTGVYVQLRSQRFFEARLREQDELEEERRLALYKQQKATQRAVAQSDKAVRRMAAQAQKTQEDTVQLQRQVDAHFASPAIKRLVNREADRG